MLQKKIKIRLGKHYVRIILSGLALLILNSCMDSTDFQDNFELLSIEYHDNGLVKEVGYKIHNKKEGLWKYFNKQGYLTREAYYKNGIQYGEERGYVEGYLSSVINYKDGDKDGRAIFYFFGENKVYQEGKYKKGKEFGLWTEYNEDGRAYSIDFYSNGLLEHTIYRDTTTKLVTPPPKYPNQH